MDIKIEAPKHPNQRQLIDFYNKKLVAKYGNYDFIKSIDVKVLTQKDGAKSISLQLKPEKGNMLFVTHTDINENSALNKAISKMNTRIEKYKEQHYHSAHTVKKSQSK